MANDGKSFGEPAKRLAVKIAIELITGNIVSSDYKNSHMERGHEQEHIARSLYEEKYFCDVLNGGFFEDGKQGGSPDGLISESGLIEIKSVLPNIQYEYISAGGISNTSYKWQCYGNLKITEREWLDYVTYCANYPAGKQLYIHRIYMDEKIYNEIDIRVNEFFEVVEECKLNIMNHES
jgi:hypothetical protein